MKWIHGLLLLSMCEGMAFADASVLLISGKEEGDHPSPIFVAPVKRGDRWALEFKRGIAQVTYPDQAIISERVITEESGGKVTCPWYQKLDGSLTGVRVNEPYTAKFDERVDCSDGTCKAMGKSIPQAELLFGRYKLPKCKFSSGEDYGFAASLWSSAGSVQICCAEFTVERLYSEMHFFDQLLEMNVQREQAIEDLDVDFKKIYLTFENSKGERSNCQIADLFKGGNDIVIDNLRDCILPEGNQFMMYAESRFFLKDTRPCGKLVTRGQKQTDGTYVPDWYMGWYECDKKVDRSPIMKQFTYPTRIELNFIDMNIQGGGKLS